MVSEFNIGVLSGRHRTGRAERRAHSHTRARDEGWLKGGTRPLINIRSRSPLRTTFMALNETALCILSRDTH